MNQKSASIAMASVKRSSRIILQHMTSTMFTGTPSDIDHTSLELNKRYSIRFEQLRFVLLHLLNHFLINVL